MRPRSVRGTRGLVVHAALLAALLVASALAGCVTHTPQDEAKARQARSQALIDAGNAAYRSHDYDLAAKRYAAAVVVKKDDAAAYFGLGMALKKLGRDEEARAAYGRARELAQEQRSAEAAAK